MVVDGIPTPVLTFAGSTFAGFFCGYALRKILKILLIVAGTALGFFYLGLQYMANNGYLGSQVSINWDRIGNVTAIAFQNLYSQFSSQHIIGVLGIPATTGVAAGIAIGLVRG
jgi:uncharacterized membrane protein (Fun14 family)